MTQHYSKSIYSYSFGLAFTAFAATAAGFCFVGYWIYEYAYYTYINTKNRKLRDSGYRIDTVQSSTDLLFLDSPKFLSVPMPTPK